MRITESQLRRIIAEEAQRFKRGRRVNESLMTAQENLYNAMQEFVEESMNQMRTEDPAGACAALREEVEGFCQSFVENY